MTNPLLMGMTGYSSSQLMGSAFSDMNFYKNQFQMLDAMASTGLFGLPQAQQGARAGSKADGSEFDAKTMVGDINILMKSQFGYKVKLDELKTMLQDAKDPNARQELIKELGEKGIRGIFDTIQKVDVNGEGYEDVIAYFAKPDAKNGKFNLDLLSNIHEAYAIDAETYQFGKKAADSESANEKKPNSSHKPSLPEGETSVVGEYKSTSDALKDDKVQAKLVKEMRNSLNGLKKEFEASLKDDGWMSTIWDGAKNKFGGDYSSNRTKEMLDNFEAQLIKLEDSPGLDRIKALYTQVTNQRLESMPLDELENVIAGTKLKKDGVEQNILTGSKLDIQVKGYEDGQETASGISYGLGATAFAAGAIAAAPVALGGLAVTGIAMAGGAAGGVVTLITDTLGNDRELTGSRIASTARWGAFDGATLGAGKALTTAGKAFIAGRTTGAAAEVAEGAAKAPGFFSRAWNGLTGLFKNNKPATNNVNPMPELYTPPSTSSIVKAADHTLDKSGTLIFDADDAIKAMIK